LEVIYSLNCPPAKDLTKKIWEDFVRSPSNPHKIDPAEVESLITLRGTPPTDKLALLENLPAFIQPGSSIVEFGACNGDTLLRKAYACDQKNIPLNSLFAIDTHIDARLAGCCAASYLKLPSDQLFFAWVNALYPIDDFPFEGPQTALELRVLGAFSSSGIDQLQTFLNTSQLERRVSSQSFELASEIIRTVDDEGRVRGLFSTKKI
jgi:hypothetical protein